MIKKSLVQNNIGLLSSLVLSLSFHVYHYMYFAVAAVLTPLARLTPDCPSVEHTSYMCLHMGYTWLPLS
jgi:hypothetical protein